MILKTFVVLDDDFVWRIQTKHKLTHHKVAKLLSDFLQQTVVDNFSGTFETNFDDFITKNLKSYEKS